MAFTRRDFLKATAAASVALSAPAVHAAKAGKKYRTALIGKWGLGGPEQWTSPEGISSTVQTVLLLTVVSLAIIGGLVVGTGLTLYVVPAMYTYLTREITAEELDDEQYERGIDGLIEQELLTPVSDGEAGYAFRDELTRAVTYETLPSTARRSSRSIRLISE